MTEPVRLAKRLAELVSCSRREAELYIEGGWVTVDGQRVEEPQFKVVEQKVELDPLAQLEAVAPVTILYHLSTPTEIGGPFSVARTIPHLTAEMRSMDDPSPMRPLKRHFSKMTAPLPLEENAVGLMVLTQDWRVLRKLVDNAASVEQEYIVEVTGELSSSGLKRMNHAVTINGLALPASKVSWQNESRLRFAVKAAQPGQIAYLCKSVELEIVAMRRIRIGRVAMARLQPETWRYLLSDERF